MEVANHKQALYVTTKHCENAEVRYLNFVWIFS